MGFTDSGDKVNKPRPYVCRMILNQGISTQLMENNGDDKRGA
jgi:hypothetical protein